MWRKVNWWGYLRLSTLDLNGGQHIKVLGATCVIWGFLPSKCIHEVVGASIRGGRDGPSRTPPGREERLTVNVLKPWSVVGGVSARIRAG